MNVRQIVENASVYNTYKKCTSSITTVHTLKKKKIVKKFCVNRLPQKCPFDICEKIHSMKEKVAKTNIYQWKKI